MRSFIFLKLTLISVLLFGAFTLVHAQTKIKDNTVVGSTLLPARDAILELESTQRGFLPPRMSTAQRNAIATPDNGLVIYNTTEGCLDEYNGTAWISLCGALPVTDTSKVSNPTAGMVIYDTTSNTVAYYDGAKWIISGGNNIQNLTTQQINNITNPTPGQLVYNTDNQSFEYYNATTGSWESLVVPSMTTAQRNTITNPAAGQTIYNTDEKCLDTYDSASKAWISDCKLLATDTSKVSNPTAGMTIYDTTSNTVDYYDGTKWIVSGGIQNLTTQQINNITNPAPGQLVYNTDNQSFEYYNATTGSWESLVVPSMTTVQRNAIKNPASGQTIYNTDEKCLDTYDSTSKAWISDCKLLVTDTSKVSNPTAGMTIYDSSSNTVDYYDGTKWIVGGSIQNLTTQQINNITNPAPGQLVYNTDNQSFEYYNATTGSWESLVVPSMTTAQRNSIKNPAAGQTIYNTDEKCLDTYDSASKAWISDCKLLVTDTTKIKNPTVGMTIYDTTSNTVDYYNGTKWVVSGAITKNDIVSGTASATATAPLTVTNGAGQVVGGTNAILAVNNTAPLFNGNQIQGISISTTAPSDGQVLSYDAASKSVVWQTKGLQTANGKVPSANTALTVAYQSGSSSATSWYPVDGSKGTGSSLYSVTVPVGKSTVYAGFIATNANNGYVTFSLSTSASTWNLVANNSTGGITANPSYSGFTTFAGVACAGEATWYISNTTGSQQTLYVWVTASAVGSVTINGSSATSVQPPFIIAAY